ncbi:IclR family transcriptional regulator [Litchfieldia alkalitelluris]|uniref:IclR family transcriptional regulator n=1 Tax=Litchfieldia alkalitelluris TaxID=304268 RepID=UPI000996A357|nr:IclR family transcriptional regulator [Litchfieldia alkalitelluris]
MTLKTLDNALELLEYFKRESSWGVRELAKELSLSPTVTHRLLSTLQNHGYIIQNPTTKKYELGLKFLEFSVLVQNKLKIKDHVFPSMELLAKETGETIFLTMLDGLKGLSVAIAESPQSIKFQVTVGTQKSLHAAASNLIILAFLPEDKQTQILSGHLEKVTENTITDPEELKAVLKRLKQQGWCFTNGETTPDAFGIGVPLFDCNNAIIGSLNVAGPTYRINEEKVKRILELTLEKRDYIQQMINSLGLTYSHIKNSI